MAKQIFKFTFKKSQVKRFVNKAVRDNDIAVIRTLNQLSKEGISMVAKEVSSDTGVKQSTVKKKIKVTSANKLNKSFIWNVSGFRLPWIRPRVIRGGPRKRGGNRRGVSHIGKGKVRKKVVRAIQRGSSKPFIVPLNFNREGTRSDKLAAYRKPGLKRKITVLVSSSVPFVLRRDWQTRVLRRLTIRLPIVYKRQLAKVKFR